MPSQGHYPSPMSSPGFHGGDMDPNEVRLRQTQVQSTSISSAAEIKGTNPSHGGDMDPNEFRLRQASGQQASGPSVQASAPASQGAGGPPNATHLPQQSYSSPAPYGSTTSLMSTPTSPPFGHQGSPSRRSPQSPYSGQNFLPQTGLPTSSSNQAQQLSWTPRPGFQAQASLPSPSIESTRLIVKEQRKYFHDSSSSSAEPSITAEHLRWAILSDPKC